RRAAGEPRQAAAGHDVPGDAAVGRLVELCRARTGVGLAAAAAAISAATAAGRWRRRVVRHARREDDLGYIVRARQLLNAHAVGDEERARPGRAPVGAAVHAPCVALLVHV